MNHLAIECKSKQILASSRHSDGGERVKSYASSAKGTQGEKK